MEKSRILVVEDETIIALYTMRLLESKGLEVVGTVCTGEEAIQCAGRDKPDVILMDIVLSGEMDGISAAEEINAQYDIPIIYLTGHSDEVTLNRAKATKPYGYILKPINEDELYSTIVTATYKHNLEKQLKESEIRYRTLFDNSKSGVAIYRSVRNGRDFHFVDFNRAGEKIDMIKREEVIGKSVLEIFPGIRDFGLFEVFQRVWETGEPESHPIAQYLDNRIAGWRENYVYKLPSGEIVAIYSDETARKQAEMTIRESEERYRGIVENLPLLICRFLPASGIITYVNERYCSHFKKSQEELIGHPFLDLIPEERREKAKKHFDSLSRENPVQISVQRVEIPNGKRWLRWTDQALLDDRGRVIEYQSIGEDITEYRRAEELIKSSLAEKEMLLKEIHHRVKNNFQIINSLINLHEINIKHEEFLQVLRDLKNHIRTMSIIHDRLSRTGDIRRIDFADYIRAISQELYTIYVHDPERIGLHIDAEEIMLHMDQAITSGLILNELLTNTFKHAFPENYKGDCSIWVSLKKRRGGMVELVVRDNGPGIPEDTYLKGEQSLGMLLVTNMTEKQLEGAITLDRENGTRITITFKKK